LPLAPLASGLFDVGKETILVNGAVIPGRRTRPQMRNGAPVNLEVPGSRLRLAPE
jgi:hypothetical protein